jgi:hypothetical protein
MDRPEVPNVYELIGVVGFIMQSYDYAYRKLVEDEKQKQFQEQVLKELNELKENQIKEQAENERIAKEELNRQEAIKQEKRKLEAQMKLYRQMLQTEITEMSRRGEIEHDVGANDPRAPTKLNSLDLTLSSPGSNEPGKSAWSEVQRVEDLRQKYLDFQRKKREQQARARLEKQLEQRQIEKQEREMARQELERKLEAQHMIDAEREKQRQQQLREIYFGRQR